MVGFWRHAVEPILRQSESIALDDGSIVALALR